MKFSLLFLLFAGSGLLTGCACNPGYFAPPYKPAVIGCTLALVPVR